VTDRGVRTRACRVENRLDAWRFALCLAVTAPSLFSQNIPHLAYALPAGGQQGASFQVTLGGQFLPNVTDVFVSGKGVSATVKNYARPMNGQQATDLRDKMQELQKQPMSPAVFQQMLDIRVKLLTFNTGRLSSPVLAETVTLDVTISPDAAPGKRELRVATPQGLSNPLVFCVGQLPEFMEKETLNIVQPPNQQNINQVRVSQSLTDMAVTLPAIVNGRIKPGLVQPQGSNRSGQPYMPGEADRYRFQARQGQHLVIAANARELIPYLADAVPGWFQAVLTLYDSGGNEVAYDDDYRFHPDPVIHYLVPKDGEYTVEIKDALYRGREDFVYRIAIGELPFITGTFPLGGAAHSKTKVELTGWNLPANKITMDGKDKKPGIYPLTAHDRQRLSNTVPFMVDTLPEALEKEPNNTQANAQKVKLPIIVNGRIDRPGDWDVFSFSGRAGQAIVAEAYARRLDSPLDSVLKLTDRTGKQLAFNDDFEDKGAGLETHHADSRILTTLPANGTYYLYIGDAQQKGGPEYAYRLRISEPRPDFELRASPSEINVAGGMTVPITVTVLRKDGFSGEIALSLKDGPRGFALTGAAVPAGMDEVRLTLTVPPQPQREPISLNLEGRALIQGHEIVRAAVPAENMMQAFFYWHLVPESDLKIAFRRSVMFRTPVRVSAPQPLKISSGATIRLRAQVPLPPNSPIQKVQFELSDPPPGIELKESSPVQDGTEIVIACDAAKIKPGLKGNLIINITGERTPPANAKQQAPARQRISLGALPAIPFEIAPQNREITALSRDRK